jgi:ETFB lysine methyltransferase
MSSRDDIPAWSELASRYDVVESALEIGGRTVRLTHVRDINALVDAMGPDDFGPDERLPYWAVLWSASQDLGAWLFAQKEPLGRTIELGSGLGLGAICAALTGASVVATDYERDAVGFVRHNAALNEVQLLARLADWRRLELEQEKFDTVIASDVLYEARHVVPFAAAIAHLTAEDGTAIVADPGRPHLVSFEEELAARGFTVSRVRVGSTAILEGRRDTFTRPTP